MSEMKAIAEKMGGLSVNQETGLRSEDSELFRLRWMCAGSWTNLARNLVETRRRKSEELAEQERDEPYLDVLDTFESELCCEMYTRFCQFIGRSQDRAPFSKSSCDREMEDYFGSLKSTGSGSAAERASACGNLDEPARVFSNYLARKVWVAVPWRHYDEAVAAFRLRVGVPAPQHPASDRVIRIGRKIVACLLEGKDVLAYQRTEPNSDGACVELPKNKGGKRVAQYLQNLGSDPDQRVRPAAIYTGGKVRVVTRLGLQHAFCVG